MENFPGLGKTEMTPSLDGGKIYTGVRHTSYGDRPFTIHVGPDGKITAEGLPKARLTSRHKETGEVKDLEVSDMIAANFFKGLWEAEHPELEYKVEEVSDEAPASDGETPEEEEVVEA
jgi:hypothetical protein